jgi:hypothetical protein
MNSINSGLPIVGQSFTRGSNQPVTNGNKSFTIHRGKIPTQAKNFIAKYDTNKDGVLNFKEYQQAGTLTDGMKSTVASPKLAKALFAMYAGPSGTLNAAEWARSTTWMDEDFDGKITQAELDTTTALQQDRLRIDPELAIPLTYGKFVSGAQDLLGFPNLLLPSGQIDPEVNISLGVDMANFASALVGQFGEQKKNNAKKIIEANEKYYPATDTKPTGTSEDTFNLEFFYDLSLTEDYRLNKSLVSPQNLDFIGSTAYLQNAKDYYEISTLMNVLGEVLASASLESDYREIAQLPLNHPDRPQLLANYNMGLQALKKEQQLAEKVWSTSQHPVLSSFSPNPALKKVLDLILGMPQTMAVDAYGILKKLKGVYLVDTSASSKDIQKHLVGLEPSTESFYKTLVYKLGTPSNQDSQQMPEIYDSKNWGTQAQNLSWTSFANNAANA